MASMASSTRPSSRWPAAVDHRRLRRAGPPGRQGRQPASFAGFALAPRLLRRRPPGRDLSGPAGPQSAGFGVFSCHCLPLVAIRPARRSSGRLFSSSASRFNNRWASPLHRRWRAARAMFPESPTWAAAASRSAAAVVCSADCASRAFSSRRVPWMASWVSASRRSPGRHSRLRVAELSSSQVSRSRRSRRGEQRGRFDAGAAADLRFDALQRGRSRARAPWSSG